MIRVRGARENNLRGVDLDIPKRRLTVFTGVSGSGKSSLVFDTVAAESRRLINETYSSFIQGFMPSLGRPDVDVLCSRCEGRGLVNDIDLDELVDRAVTFTTCPECAGTRLNEGARSSLVDAGRSVIVVEHHMAVMAHADWIIDMGPGAGHDGGRVVFEGTPRDLVASGATLTGRHLADHVGEHR